MPLVFAVAAGSALGGVARYLVSSALADRHSGGFPLGTLVVNIVGSFVLGALVRYTTVAPALSPMLRLLIGAGFCGGFTTFSAFSVETLDLVQRGEHTRALLYVSLSIVTGLAAAVAGMSLAATFVER